MGQDQRLCGLIHGDSLRARFLRGGVGSVGIQVSQITLGVLLAVVLARVLGAEGYGTYTYVYTLIAVLAIPVQLGLPILIVRETAKAQAAGDWTKLKGVWCWSAAAVGKLSLVLIVVSGATAWAFARHFSELQIATFAWGILLVPLFAIGALCGAALRGLGKVLQGQITQAILRPGLLIVSVLATVWLLPNDKVTPAYAMSLHVFAAFAAFAMGAVLLSHARPEEVRRTRGFRFEKREWLMSTLPLAVIGGVQLINQYTDVLMLGFFTSAEDIGIYRVAMHGATLVSFGLSAIGIVTTPYFARFYELNEMKQFQRLSTMSARAMLIIALPAGIVLIIFGGAILRLVFGPAFEQGHSVLSILVLGHIVHAGFGSVGPLLNMTGHERATAKWIMLAGACNVILNGILIPLYGMIGAAIATSITLVIWNCVLWRAVRTNLGVDSSALGFFTRV